MRPTILAAAFLLALSGCSSIKEKQSGEEAVARFHGLYDKSQAAAIWDKAGPELQRSVPRDGFAKMLDTVHQRLGNVKKADQKGWTLNYATGGNSVSFTYSTDFALGRGDEQFVYRMTAGTPVLAGYHITSQALLSD